MNQSWIDKNIGLLLLFYFKFFLGVLSGEFGIASSAPRSAGYISGQHFRAVDEYLATQYSIVR